MVTSYEWALTDRSPTAAMAYSLGKLRLLCLMALLLSLAFIHSSPAKALDKTVNGITVDVNLPHARRGVPYQFQILPSGQSSPYSFQLIAGSLPTGFILSSSGLVSGVSCDAPNGTYKFDVRIISENGIVADFSGTNGFSINMTAGPCKTDVPGGSDETDGTGDTDSPDSSDGTGGTDGSGDAGGSGGSGTDGPDNSGGTDGTDGTDGSGGADGSGGSGTDGTGGTPNTGGATDNGGSSNNGGANTGSDGSGTSNGPDTSHDSDGGADSAGDQPGTTDSNDTPDATEETEGSGSADAPGYNEGSDNSDGTDSVDDTDVADGTGTTDGTGGTDDADDSDKPSPVEAPNDNGSPGAGTPDGTTNSDGNDGSEDSDGPDAPDGSDGNDGADGADQDNGLDDTQDTTTGAEVRPIRAANGEIVIDLTTSPTQTGTIDLASLTTSNLSMGPVSYEIVGRPIGGNVKLAGSQLTYMPSQHAITDTVDYVAVQGTVRSNVARVAVRMLRASLVDDPKLIDSTRAQLDAAAGVGFLQLDAIGAHLEAGSWDDACLVQNRVTLHSANGPPNAPANAERMGPREVRQCRKSESVRFWASGVITVDDQAGSISTDGLTAGIEAAPGSTSLAGLAVGLSRSQSGLSDANDLHLESLSLTAYGAWRAARRVHVSGAFGYAGVDVNVRRQLGAGEQYGSMSRNGHLWFAMLRAAADFEIQKIFVSSYARVGLVKVQLKGGQEQSVYPLAVTVGNVGQTQLEGLFGATVRRPFQLAKGTLAPFVRLEHRLRAWDQFAQSVSYLSEPRERTVLRGENNSNGSWVFGTGASYQVGRIRLVGEYILLADPNLALGNGALRLGLSAGF